MNLVGYGPRIVVPGVPGDYPSIRRYSECCIVLNVLNKVPHTPIPQYHGDLHLNVGGFGDGELKASLLLPDSAILEWNHHVGKSPYSIVFILQGLDEISTLTLSQCGKMLSTPMGWSKHCTVVIPYREYYMKHLDPNMEISMVTGWNP